MVLYRLTDVRKPVGSEFSTAVRTRMSAPSCISHEADNTLPGTYHTHYEVYMYVVSREGWYPVSKYFHHQPGNPLLRSKVTFNYL